MLSEAFWQITSIDIHWAVIWFILLISQSLSIVLFRVLFPHSDTIVYYTVAIRLRSYLSWNIDYYVVHVVPIYSLLFIIHFISSYFLTWLYSKVIYRSHSADRDNKRDVDDQENVNQKKTAVSGLEFGVMNVRSLGSRVDYNWSC